MKVPQYLLMFLFFGGAAFAAEGHGATDILPRTVNFLIFAALTYYLLAEKIKLFFVGRTQSIADQYAKAENQVKEMNALLNEAKVKKEEALRLADEMIVSVQGEAINRAKKIAESTEAEIARIKKAVDDEKNMRTKKAIIEAVENGVTEIIEKNGFGIDDTEFAAILAKRVA